MFASSVAEFLTAHRIRCFFWWFKKKKRLRGQPSPIFDHPFFRIYTTKIWNLKQFFQFAVSARPIQTNTYMHASFLAFQFRSTNNNNKSVSSQHSNHHPQIQIDWWCRLIHSLHKYIYKYVLYILCSILSCVALGCLTPAPPLNGRLVYKTEYIAKYICDPAFVFPDTAVHSRELSCTSRNTWDKSLPDCVGTYALLIYKTRSTDNSVCENQQKFHLIVKQ